MQARQAVKKFGELLIGKTIKTEPYGNWPGGLARVKDIYPPRDIDIRMIVMYIEGLEKQTEDSFGVLWDQEIEIV